MITTIKLPGEIKAEHQPYESEERPARVDVWRGVIWLCQLEWIDGSGFSGKCLTRASSAYLNDETKGKIAHALRERGC